MLDQTQFPKHTGDDAVANFGYALPQIFDGHARKQNARIFYLHPIVIDESRGKRDQPCATLAGEDLEGDEDEREVDDRESEEGSLRTSRTLSAPRPAYFRGQTWARSRQGHKRESRCGGGGGSVS